MAACSALASARVPIGQLNDGIQERFKDVDEQFGIRRIVTTRTPHRFTPETVAESRGPVRY